MIKRLFFVRTAKFVLLVFGLILFCMLYLLPSIKRINHLKRNIKDKTIAISDFSKREQTFKLPNQKEVALFNETDQRLRKIIPLIKSQGGDTSLWLEHANHLRSLAAKSNIQNLIICSDKKGEKNKPLGLNPGSRQYRRLYRFCHDNMRDAVSKASINLFQLLGGQTSLMGNGPPLQSMFLIMAFRADIRNGSRFVYQLNRKNVLTHMVSLKVQGDEGLPFWLILLKLYYLEMKSVQKSAPGGRDEDFPLIDLYADILLRDISNYVRQMGKRELLPDQFGGRIFRSFSTKSEENQRKKFLRGED